MAIRLQLQQITKGMIIIGTGYLTVRVTTADEALPPPRAHITVKDTSGNLLHETYTDENGYTATYEIPAPDRRLTLDPNYEGRPYAAVDVTAAAPGFVTQHIHGVMIEDGETGILPIEMKPLEAGADNQEEDKYIPPPALILPPIGAGPAGPQPTAALPSALYSLRAPLIPEYITVHLGRPDDASAKNVRVKFSDYVANVASHEVYATWPYNALVANIIAIQTFALNRIYTEWYRSQGKNFDITNSPAFDQAYVDGGNVFANISQITDELAGIYAHRIGFENPFFTQFCNGTTVTCNGLSQWGTVALAAQGLSPLEILRYYYPNDLTLTRSDNIGGIVESYPGTPLRRGSAGADVMRIQNFLNRIRVNFPLIPQIRPTGTFDKETEEAVTAFQKQFNLTQDGIVGRAAWNKISSIYVAVTRLGELDSEGVRIGLSPTPPTVTIRQGARGEDVVHLQFLLNYIAQFYDSVPTVIKDSYFGVQTRDAVEEFQKTFGLTVDGIVGPITWSKLYSVYRGIKESEGGVPEAPPPIPSPGTPQYPGAPLRVGSSGDAVRTMQAYLNVIAKIYPSIPTLTVDGAFGPLTEAAVIRFQQQFMLTPDGIIGPITWNKIVEQYLIATGGVPAPTPPAITPPYPGTPLRVGSLGNNVRTMQQYLTDLRGFYPGLPVVAADGVFGPQTQAAVMAFQRMFGLSPDGIIGPITWNGIVERRNAVVG